MGSGGVGAGRGAGAGDVLELDSSSCRSTRSSKLCDTIGGSPSVSLELDGFEKLHLYPSKMRYESSPLRVPPNGLFLGLFPPSLLLFARALKLESFQ